MKVINLSDGCSILNSIVAQMRDRNIQKDRQRFRSNLKKVGNIFAYELSRKLNYSEKKVWTPLAEATVSTCDDKIVVATILRAGLPLHEGILDFFDDADSAFISAYRKYDKIDDYHINIEYCAAPDIEGKVLVLADTMLATGMSMLIAYEKLCEYGTPSHTHLVCPISSVFAVEYLQKNLPNSVTLWTAALDEELTSQSYIVPGIGDAGDLCYGDKK